MSRAFPRRGSVPAQAARVSPEANVQPPRPARLEAYIPRSAELSRLFRVVRVGREQADADARRGGEAAADVERPLEGLADAAGDALGHRGGRLGRHVAEHDHELVAAQPDDQVGRAGGHAQPAGDLLQQLVIRVVAEPAVDVLERVDVEVEQGRCRAVVRRPASTRSRWCSTIVRKRCSASPWARVASSSAVTSRRHALAVERLAVVPVDDDRLVREPAPAGLGVAQPVAG